MTNKILRSILSVAATVLIASLVIVTGVLYDYFADMQSEQLKDELSLAAAATEQIGETYLTTLNSDRYRLTLVAEDGTVIYDTDADAEKIRGYARLRCRKGHRQDRFEGRFLLLCGQYAESGDPCSRRKICQSGVPHRLQQ